MDGTFAPILYKAPLLGSMYVGNTGKVWLPVRSAGPGVEAPLVDGEPGRLGTFVAPPGATEQLGPFPAAGTVPWPLWKEYEVWQIKVYSFNELSHPTIKQSMEKGLQISILGSKKFPTLNLVFPNCRAWSRLERGKKGFYAILVRNETFLAWTKVAFK